MATISLPGCMSLSNSIKKCQGSQTPNSVSFRHDYRCRSGGAMPRKKMLSFRHDGLCRGGICLSVNQHPKKQISPPKHGHCNDNSRHSDTAVCAVEESACESINIATSRFLRPNTGRRNDTSRHSDSTICVVEESACESINILKADLRPNTGHRNETSRHSDTTVCVVEESACESINIAKS
jgi:hypothetical protein